MMNFCIPYLTIEPIISKLSAQYWYSSVRRGATTENLNILKERISSIDVSVVAEIGSMNLSVRDVLSLRPGDVIRLPNVRVDDTMVLSIGNQKKFLCRPGVVGNKLAVQVTHKLEETRPEDFEELAAGGEESV
jgi:flagellar motor switch protein FliM